MENIIPRELQECSKQQREQITQTNRSIHLFIIKSKEGINELENTLICHSQILNLQPKGRSVFGVILH